MFAWMVVALTPVAVTLLLGTLATVTYETQLRMEGQISNRESPCTEAAVSTMTVVLQIPEHLLHVLRNSSRIPMHFAADVSAPPIYARFLCVTDRPSGTTSVNGQDRSIYDAVYTIDRTSQGDTSRYPWMKEGVHVVAGYRSTSKNLLTWLLAGRAKHGRDGNAQ